MAEKKVVAPKLALSSARKRTLLIGVGALAVTGVILSIVDVDSQIAAAPFFAIPVLVAAVLWDTLGGLVAGMLAGTAINAIGTSTNAPLRWEHGFFAFGLLGAWALRQIAGEVVGREAGDLVDPITGLHNARFFLRDIDLEVARAHHYDAIFSVVVIDLPVASLERLPRRWRMWAIKDIARALKDALRTVDKVVYATDETRHRFVLILPETAADGATIVLYRLAERVATILQLQGGNLGVNDLTQTIITLPGNETELKELREQFKLIDRRDHPEEDYGEVDRRQRPDQVVL